MGTYGDLNGGGGGGGTYRQLQGGSPPAKPAAKGGDPRKSADYQALMASANRTRDVTDKALGSIPFLGAGLKRTRDEGMGALAGLPFADEAIGLADKGLMSGVNLFRRAAGAPEIDPDAAYLAGKDFANQSKAKALKESPVSARATQLLTMVAGPGKALKAVKAIPALRAGGAALAEAAPGLLDAGGKVAALAGKAVPAGSVARAGATGGLLGAVYGADEGDTLGERAKNAAQGLLGGTIFGTGLHVAAPLAKPVLGLVGDAGRRAGEFLTKPFMRGGADVADAPATAAQLEQAAQAATRMAARGGLTSPAAVVEKATADFGDKPATAAEVIGRPAVTQLGAAGRRAGKTAGALEEQLTGRRTGAAERIKQDFASDLGLNPDEAGGDIDAIVQAAHERAQPLYREALAGQHGVTNPELEEILQRPVVQTAMREVQRDFRNRVRGATGLTMGRVEVPEAAAGVHPMDAPPVGEVPIAPGAEPPPVAPTPEVKVPRGPAEAPTQGPSLATFLRNRGLGIDDVGGDLDGMNLRIRRGGGSLDDHALAAHEAGYFPELQGERPTINHLLEALADHSRGKPRYAQEADQAATQRFQARAAGEEQNRALSDADYQRQQDSDAAFRTEQARHAEQAAAWERQQAEIGPHQEDWRSLETGTEAPAGGGEGVNAPNFEPAYQEAPTPAAWDAIKKKVGNLVSRDAAGRPILTGREQGRNQGYIDADTDLRRLLAGTKEQPGALGSQYGPALDTAGEKLGTQAAFRRMSGKLTQGDMRTFGRFWATLRTDAEQAAGRAALANDVLNMANNGQLRGGKFSTPGIQERLEIAFKGKGNTRQFLQKMEQEAALAKTGGRMMPGTGSGTAEWQAAMDQGSDNELEAAGEVLGHAASGSAAGAVKAILKNYGLKLHAYSKTAGVPVQVRDELGRLLMLDPASFAEFLATRNPATLRPFQSPAGAIGGALTGAAIQDENR